MRRVAQIQRDERMEIRSDRIVEGRDGGALLQAAGYHFSGRHVWTKHTYYRAAGIQQRERSESMMSLVPNRETLNHSGLDSLTVFVPL